jgi:hypothetical protein
MNENTPSTFCLEQGREVRTLERNGETWFAAQDVCDILGVDSPGEVKAGPKKKNDFKIGGKVKFGRINDEPITWLIGEQNHKGYPADTVTMIAERTLGNITFSVASPLHRNRDRRLYGSNHYIDSYARGYMNSDAFLNAVFSPEELAAIAETKIKTIQPDIDGGGLDFCNDRLFFLSASEVGFSGEDFHREGSIIELFKDTNFRRALDIDGEPDWYWLRTPYASSSSGVRLVGAGGALSSHSACYGYHGFRPACNLASDYLESLLK